jgi:hypothetical protein
MKSKSEIALQADIYRLQLQNLRQFLAESLTESAGEQILLKDLERNLQAWATQNAKAVISGVHPLRRHMQAWGYTVKPDDISWKPLLCGYFLKPE